MAGQQSWGDWVGERSELFAELILGSVAFTTRVRRHDDVGHDIYCVLKKREGDLLRAAPYFFTVQVKSSPGRVVYNKDHEIKWIKSQVNPFFLCIAKVEEFTLELYSTWNMHTGFLLEEASQIELIPEGDNASYKKVETVSGVQRVHLGKPFLRIEAKDSISDDRVGEYSEILRQWIKLEQENIVNRQAGMYWIAGPTVYETNKPLPGEIALQGSPYWNKNNLRTVCLRNLSRAATHFRLALDMAIKANEEKASDWLRITDDLDRVLKSYSAHLEPLAKRALKEAIGLDVDGKCS